MMYKYILEDNENADVNYILHQRTKAHGLNDINVPDNSFDFEVTDEDHYCLYAPFYFYDCGRNLMLEEIIDNVDEVFQQLARNKVLWRVKKK